MDAAMENDVVNEARGSLEAKWNIFGEGAFATRISFGFFVFAVPTWSDPCRWRWVGCAT
jgi:hypothetical protein